jgi:hypothetical protein
VEQEIGVVLLRELAERFENPESSPQRCVDTLLVQEEIVVIKREKIVIEASILLGM